MNNQFDEFTKSLAQSVTRRAALKKCGVSLVGMALACFGLGNKAHAAPPPCQTNQDCEHLGLGYGCCHKPTGPVCLPLLYCMRGP